MCDYVSLCASMCHVVCEVGYVRVSVGVIVFACTFMPVCSCVHAFTVLRLCVCHYEFASLRLRVTLRAYTVGFSCMVACAWGAYVSHRVPVRAAMCRE